MHGTVEAGLARRSGRAWDAAAAVLAAGLALLALLTFRDYGVGWDDPGLVVYGRLLRDFYASGLADLGFTRHADLVYYGGAFELAWALLEPMIPGDPLVARHLLCAAVGLLGLLATAAIARRLAGPRAGLLALLLLALSPDWQGHQLVNAKDVPFATAMTVALLLACRAIERWPQPSPATVLGLGAATGLALGVRIGGLAAPLPLLAAVLLPTLRAARAEGAARAGRALAAGLLRLAPAVLVAISVTLLTWPWIGLAPDNLVEALRHFAALDFPLPVLFRGRVVPATELPGTYLPLLLALKLPELLLAGLALLALAAVRGRVPLEPRLVAVLTAAGLPLLHALLAAPTQFDGIRHHLFVLPPLAVLAALGLERALEAAGQALRPALAALILAGAGLAGARLVAVHPYEYVAFNALAGGTHGAEGRFELDYWATSLREVTRLAAGALAAEALDHPARPWQVAVCGEPATLRAVLPPYLEPVADPEAADLLLSAARPSCPTPPERPLAEVRREGALLGFAAVRSPRLAAARAGALTAARAPFRGGP